MTSSWEQEGATKDPAYLRTAGEMKVGVGGGRERLKKKGDLPRLSISEFKNVFTDLTEPLPRHFSPNCLLSFFSLRASGCLLTLRSRREKVSTNGEKKIDRNRGKETQKRTLF